MPFPILILAVTGFLAVAAFAVLAVLITGIRRGDRRHLANSPGSHSDAFARRILVGVRFLADDEEGDEQ